MNHSNSPSAANGHTPPPGMGLDDVLYTVFRHKWLILSFLCLGVLGAGAVRVMRPPLYVSKAKLMVHYVAERGSVTATSSADAEHLHAIDGGAQAIMNSQIEILTTFDIALKVADKIGPARILAKRGGGSNKVAAAAVIASGIEVDPPRSAIITVSFKHPDQDIVQPVLDALIQTYMQKHLDVYVGPEVLNEYLVHRRDELRNKLGDTELKLKQAKDQANILFMDETKHSYQTQIAKVRDELLDAERDLAERKAMLGNLPEGQGGSASSNIEAAVPADKVNDYGEINAELDTLKKSERELLRMYKEAYPLVQTVRARIEKLTKQKEDLETRYAALSHMVLTSSRGGTNVPGANVASDFTEIKRLNARVAVLSSFLSNITVQASHVVDLEPKIAEYNREHDEQERDYQAVMRQLDQRQAGATALSDKISNMSVVENPTPPHRDYKKVLKLVGMAFAGCAGMGLGLAFLIDLVIDRTIKRSVDIERHLKLPVMLAIPDVDWNAGSRVRWPGGNGQQEIQAKALPVQSEMDVEGDPENGMMLWDPATNLQSYAEGLRERVRTYFEINNMDLKKPKLVAVTGCGKGAGVSTLATGLASELSKTGDGNVLLVEMNGEEGSAHAFHMGKPGCGVAEALATGPRVESQVQERLFVASLQEGTSSELAMVLPKRFKQLVPQLKASDYDYIVFDMPPVSATSPTPRLASHMDITLLVMESEKTGQKAAERAARLMRESRATVAAVLNKCRQHVPAQLSQEL
jgi:succinoglycan biosynthesis transport protein ExoP